MFPKGSSLVLDISEAILRVRESGEVQRLERELLSSSSECYNSPSNLVDDDPRLGIQPFWGLFLVSVGISVAALLITVARLLGKHCSAFAFSTITLTKIRIFTWASLMTLFSSTNGSGMESINRSNVGGVGNS